MKSVEDKKFCIHCGTELERDMRFCTTCGVPVVAEENKVEAENVEVVDVVEGTAVEEISEFTQE